MTFVNLSLVAGATLIAVPIILHLIMRRKPKLFEFPALRFLQRRHDTNQRRLRLRHLLLLLLRAAAIALLAFALARPSVQFAGSLGSQEAPVAAALVFDAAPRMQYRLDNQTRLESAKQMALELLAQLPEGSQIAVLDTRLGQPAFQADRGAAKQRIQQLEAVANSQPLPSVIDAAFRLLASGGPERKEVYVFTDLARGAWPSDAASRLHDHRTNLPAAGVYLIDVGVAEPANYALGDVRLSAQVLSSRSTLTLSTELFRAAPAAAGPEGRNIELYMLDANGQPQKRAEEVCTLAPGATQQVDFRIGGLEVGTHQGYLRIVGQDALPDDDARFFTVAVRPPWRVLLAAPEPAAEKVRFLQAALAPETARKRGQTRFDCEVADLADLDKRDLGPYATVCLMDPGPLAPATWRKLADYASLGRGVAVFLGRNARPIEAFNLPEAQEVLPGRLATQARRPEGDCYLAPRDYQHPILSAFRGVAGAVPWDAFPVFRYWQFEQPAAGVGTVIWLSDESPVLFERPIGSGRVLTLATPVSDRADERAWNLLPVGVIGNAGPFVMLANQMLAYLVGSSDEQLNYYAGQTVALRIEFAERQQDFVLLAPGGLSLPVSADPRQQRLTIAATEQPGNYRVQAGGTSAGVHLGFSVNLAPQQTELDRVDEDHLNEVFGPFRFRTGRSIAELHREISADRVGRELFAPLMLLLGAALAAEFWVANRFYREP